MKRSIRVEQGNLTEGRELLLVNPSNTNCELRSGVSSAIRTSCGRGFEDAVVAQMYERFNGPMAPGQVLITRAGLHPSALWVAHVALADYRNGYVDAAQISPQTLRAAFTNLLREIESLAAAPPISIAVPAMASSAIATLCAALHEHFVFTENSKIGAVTFYGPSFAEYVNVAEEVSAYFEIDDLPGDLRALVEEYKRAAIV